MSARITLCRYWVRADQEPRFKALIDQHWPLFRRLDLVSDAVPHLVLRGEDPERGVFYVETFPWKDLDAAERAHTLPEVAAVWEPMADCCTGMEFPFVEPVHVD